MLNVRAVKLIELCFFCPFLNTLLYVFIYSYKPWDILFYLLEMCVMLTEFFPFIIYNCLAASASPETGFPLPPPTLPRPTYISVRDWFSF